MENERKYIRKNDILQRIGIASATFERWIRKYNFPMPAKIGGKVRFWDSAEIDAWMQSQMATRSQASRQA